MPTLPHLSPNTLPSLSLPKVPAPSPRNPAQVPADRAGARHAGVGEEGGGGRVPAMQVCDCDCDCDCVCVVGEGWPCEGEGEGPPGSGKAGHAGGVAGQAPSYQACRGGGWERGAVVQGGKRVTLWLWPQQMRCTEPLFAKAHVLPPPCLRRTWPVCGPSTGGHPPTAAPSLCPCARSRPEHWAQR